MKRLRHPVWALLFAAVLLAGCGGGATGAAPPAEQVPLLLTAALQPLAPSQVGSAGSVPDLSRLSPREEPVAEFDLTTPADAPFAFQLTGQSATGRGAVRLALAHAADAGLPPFGGPGTMAEAGIIAQGQGLSMGDLWLEILDDGTCRVEVEGSIERDQTLLVEVENEAGVACCLINLIIGPPSEINPDDDGDGWPGDDPSPDLYPGIALDRAIFEVQAFLFGMPTLAGTDGVYTMHVSEGGNLFDLKEPVERRFVYDRGADTVTQADPVDTTAMFGTRSRESASHGDTLAVARATGAGLTVQFSFDNGSSYGGEQTVFSTSGGGYVEMPQVAFGPDGALAIAFWRWRAVEADDNDFPGIPGMRFRFEADLMLVEAAPGTGGYSFGDPVVLHEGGANTLPVLLGMQFSSGGDLVLGYAFTEFTFDPDSFTSSVVTENHCVTRLQGQQPVDVLVDREEIMGVDPGVALIGSGATMTVFFAYEASDGVRLRVSEDGGQTFGEAVATKGFGGHMPTVFARETDGGTRVDLLFLTYTSRGQELRLRHWEDFGSSEPEDYRLTTAVFDFEWPEGDERYAPLDMGALTEVGPYGYDAVLRGDEILVAVHEVTVDFSDMVYAASSGMPMPMGGTEPRGSEPGNDPGFPDEFPPKDLPGIDPIFPEETHTLRLLALD